MPVEVDCSASELSEGYIPLNTVVENPTGRISGAVGDMDQVFNNTVEHLPAHMVIREADVNARETCEDYQSMHPEEPDYQPHVRWFVNSTVVPGVRKLAVADNGMGMPPFVLRNILPTFGAGRDNRLDANGCKINKNIGIRMTVAVASPHGAMFYSMVNGVAHKVRYGLLRGEKPGFGLVPFKCGSLILPVTSREAVKVFPDYIREAGHGTVVVFLGKTQGEHTADTLNPYEDIASYQNGRFVYSYLSERFLDGWSAPNSVWETPAPTLSKKERGFHKVPGGAHYLKRYLRHHSVRADNKDADKLGKMGERTINMLGLTGKLTWFMKHTRAEWAEGRSLYGNVYLRCQGETYASSKKWLRAAGIWLKTNDFAFIIDLDDTNVSTNAQRTSLGYPLYHERHGQELPIEEILSHLFRHDQPEAVRARLASASSKSKSNSARSSYERQIYNMNQFLCERPVKLVKKNPGAERDGVGSNNLAYKTRGSSGSPGTPSSSGKNEASGKGSLGDSTPKNSTSFSGKSVSLSGDDVAGQIATDGKKRTTKRDRMLRRELPRLQFEWIAGSDFADGEFAAWEGHQSTTVYLNKDYPLYHECLRTPIMRHVDTVAGKREKAEAILQKVVEEKITDYIITPLAVLGEARWKTTVTPDRVAAFAQDQVLAAASITHETRRRGINSELWRDNMAVQAAVEA